MRAVVAYAAKDLRIEEVATPEVGPHEVLMRVGFGGICGSDLHYFNHGGFGAVVLREPMILGHEVAATVEEVGAAVTRVKPGDRAAVSPSLPWGLFGYAAAGDHRGCEYRLHGHGESWVLALCGQWIHFGSLDGSGYSGAGCGYADCCVAFGYCFR